MTHVSIGLMSSHDLPLKISKVKEIIYLAFKSFTQIAQRLLLLDAQILNYKKQNAYFHESHVVQYEIHSSFFNSIQAQKKLIENELIVVNSVFNEQCRTAKSIFNEIGDYEIEKEHLIYLAKKNENIIHFPKRTPNSATVNEMCDLFKRGEVFANKVNTQKHEVFTNANQAIVVMRERFR